MHVLDPKPFYSYSFERDACDRERCLTRARVGHIMAPKGKKEQGGVADLVLSKDMNPAIAVKASKRMEMIWKEHGKYEKPQQIDPDEIGISEANRPPNFAYAHATLAANIMGKGQDDERAGIGMVIEHDDPSAIKKLVDHNQHLANTVGELMPPIFANKMRNETLASQHYTVVLRLLRHQCVSPLTGVRFGVKDDEKLRMKVEKGHTYWVLKPSILTANKGEDARFVAEYKNSGQNEDNFFSFQELLRTTQRTLKAEMLLNAHVKASSVVAKMCANSIIKIKPEDVLDATKWISGMGVHVFVDMYLEYVGSNVNPREKTVSMRWFSELTTEIDAKLGTLKFAIAVTHTDGEQVLTQARPQESILITLSPNPQIIHEHF